MFFCFGIFALCVFCTVVQSQTNASCSDMYNSSSTSNCSISAGWIRDNWCDCPDCEDELYWTCSSCKQGCPDNCGSTRECGSTNDTINYDTGCNFGVYGSILLPENYCQKYSVWNPFSYKFYCNDDNVGTIEYYNDTECGEDGGNLYNVYYPNYYSCSSDTSNCDQSIYKFEYDKCDANKTNLNRGYLTNGDGACADGKKYDIHTLDGGLRYGLTFYFSDSDGGCDGDGTTFYFEESDCEQDNSSSLWYQVSYTLISSSSSSGSSTTSTTSSTTSSSSGTTSSSNSSSSSGDKITLNHDMFLFGILILVASGLKLV